MPTLTVASGGAVADRSLASLDAVKAELGITDGSSDTLLSGWIRDDSDAVSEACGVAPDQAGRRTFLREAVTISYRPNEVPCGFDPAPLVLPWRLPLDVEMVTVDGATLDADAYEVEPMAGLLWRLNTFGCRTRWERSRIVITGTAGWVLADVPAALRRAVIECVTIRWDGKDQNSYLKRDRVDGVGEQEFWTGSLPNMQGSVPASVLDGLRAAGLVNIAIG